MGDSRTAAVDLLLKLLGDITSENSTVSAGELADHVTALPGLHAVAREATTELGSKAQSDHPLQGCTVRYDRAREVFVTNYTFPKRRPDRTFGPIG